MLSAPSSQLRLLCMWPAAGCCLLQSSPCHPWFLQIPCSQKLLRDSDNYFVEFSLQSFKGRRANFEGGEGVVCHVLWGPAVRVQ